MRHHPGAVTAIDVATPAPDDARTQVFRQPPGEVAWEMWIRTPPPALRDWVAGLWAGDADASFARHRLLPNAEIWLMFNLGPPQRVVEVGKGDRGVVYRAALVSGLQQSPLVFESVIRHPRVVAVRLRPLGAFAFFGGLPQLDLTNRVVDLESVMGGAAGVETLRRRLVESAHLGAALDLVEIWLTKRLLDARSARSVTRAAVCSLVGIHGKVRVELLAHNLGVSSRYLNMLFHREVGVSAKSLARILRFEHAQEQLAAPRRRDLAWVAQECGYYDQSHLNREFQDLAGLTPTEYRARVHEQVPGFREISD